MDEMKRNPKIKIKERVVVFFFFFKDLIPRSCSKCLDLYASSNYSVKICPVITTMTCLICPLWIGYLTCWFIVGYFSSCSDVVISPPKHRISDLRFLSLNMFNMFKLSGTADFITFLRFLSFWQFATPSTPVIRFLRTLIWLFFFFNISLSISWYLRGSIWTHFVHRL